MALAIIVTAWCSRQQQRERRGDYPRRRGLTGVLTVPLSQWSNVLHISPSALMLWADAEKSSQLINDERSRLFLGRIQRRGNGFD
jgi:hypothetical protein